MTFQQAARSLNQRVRLWDKVHRIGGEFLLSAVIVRKNETGTFMQAELADPCSRSVMIAPLEYLEGEAEHESEKRGDE